MSEQWHLTCRMGDPVNAGDTIVVLVRGHVDCLSDTMGNNYISAPPPSTVDEAFYCTATASGENTVNAMVTTRTQIRIIKFFTVDIIDILKKLSHELPVATYPFSMN